MTINARRVLTLITSTTVVGMAAAGVSVSSASAASVSTQEAVSQNWSGYVAGGNSFSSVSGSWVQPTAKCTPGQSYSAFWVGLGGAGGTQAVEQTGTQADCTSDGQTDYYAWYELVPSAPVKLGLAIRPGDHIFARVDVSGTDVTIALSNRTTGASVTKSLQMSDPSNSSAEWIAEAPSSCTQAGSCQPLPLANFGTVTFTNASATANGHTGSISDSSWNAQPVQLSGDGSTGYAPTEIAYQQSGSAGAQPSSLSSDGSSFAVSWQSADSQTTTTGFGGYQGDGGDGGGGYGPGGAGGYGPGGYGDGGYGPGGYGGYGGYSYSYGY